MAAHSCRWRGFVLLLALAAIPAAGAATTPQEPLLIFDMPYGGCRLNIHGDGSAALFFAALPQHVNIKAGTFDLSELRRVFESKAHAVKSRSELAPPVGSVRLQKEAADLYFNDAELASALLRRAWTHRMLPRNEHELQDERIIARFCAD